MTAIRMIDIVGTERKTVIIGAMILPAGLTNAESVAVTAAARNPKTKLKIVLASVFPTASQNSLSLSSLKNSSNALDGAGRTISIPTAAAPINHISRITPTPIKG